ncbi:hypothetical protein THEYE_A2029 [Thermodesulfovibrio yellowstonii DSM 11347]|uniref:Uncharacterized protein n=1 Tax=Thermodesulfovibrio yellowstonii (strain ATCC 51303 / DSM 11347 / YP87) TaxID=289376 RepID=B5YIU2_THEYD|nr:hypothetical protein THEYE_A2029 [Thermodesulfovibrio yellowstonii DSM 11347]
MVQMKRRPIATYVSNSTILYIPHGSDETEIPKDKIIYNKDFISHMVQMKRMYRLYCNQYLTLYIPHGSDETLQELLSQPELISLYPTWFR